MTITDEMVEKAEDVFAAHPYGSYPRKDAIRFALEAVAPLLIVQGMREAAALRKSCGPCADELEDAILARAHEVARARLMQAIAAQDKARGRPLTAKEKLANLTKALAEIDAKELDPE